MSAEATLQEMLRSQGLEVETVADIIGDAPTPAAIIENVLPARHDDQPPFPEPGIYFGMDEGDYHAINAFSASGAKSLSVSTMDHWAGSVLNRDREDDESPFKALGRAYHVRICEGAEAYDTRYAIALDKAEYPDALITVDQLKKAIEDAGEKPRGKAKADFIDQLLHADPAAQIWEVMQSGHETENEGKAFISAKQNRRIQIAARMIESDAELSKAFTGGHAEVAIFWFDARTGCPMKAKLDYLKLGAIVDLKSFSNPFGRPVSRAIDFTISGQKHFIAVAVYQEAVAAAKAMIRERGASAVHGLDDPAWALRLAQQPEAPTCLWVYQQTGAAPVTRGRTMPRGTVFTITDGAVQSLKRRYVEATRTFGTDPWLDIAPIEATTDENIPLSATDL